MRPPAVIIAGGRASRMGGDKALLPLQGKPLLAHVLDAVHPQCSDILLNVNTDIAYFEVFGLPMRPDVIADSKGPLAGLLTGMVWARLEHSAATHILSVPCDTPFLPGNLVARLHQALIESGSDIAVARDTERIHPVIGLWPVQLAALLADHLTGAAGRSVHGWLEKFAFCTATFAADSLRNLNTPNDHAGAEARLASRSSNGSTDPS
jgi:molybdenum cofactor guanylyltransferase